MTALPALALLLSPTIALADCRIVGDSIAVGVGQQMRECSVSARVGISSGAVVARASHAETLIVSAGANNPTDRQLSQDIRKLCGRGQRVVFILPAHPGAREIVKAEAQRCGAQTVIFRPGRDGVHPQSYSSVARSVREKVR